MMIRFSYSSECIEHEDYYDTHSLVGLCVFAYLAVEACVMSSEVNEALPTRWVWSAVIQL